MKSSQPSAPATRRTCSRGRRTRTPSSSIRPAPAMKELGKVLDETKPDVILFFGADHVETFSVTCVPSFAIVAGDRAIAKFAGREHNLPIHREMAEDILNKLVVEHNFDMAYSEDAELGHAFSIPFEYVIGKRNIPVIPFFTNVYVPPLPTPRRCEALGKAIAKIVKGRKERVAIIASGGMSHFPGTTKYLHPEFDFDRWLVSQIESRQRRRAAQHDRHAARRGRQHRDAQLGGDVRRDRRACEGELIDYIPTWHHGLCMMRFLPAARARSKRHRRWRSSSAASSSRTRASSSTSTRRPRRTASTSCCSSRATAQDLRDRIINDFENVANEYELARRAARSRQVDDQRRQGRPGQRPRRAAGRGRCASAAGADGAARDLLDQPHTRPGGDGGVGSRETLIL